MNNDIAPNTLQRYYFSLICASVCVFFVFFLKNICVCQKNVVLLQPQIMLFWHNYCKKLFEKSTNRNIVMKKIVILALSAILAVSINAQEKVEPKSEKQEAKIEKPCKMDKGERIEREIRELTRELYLGEEQAKKFAETYRDYATKLDEIFEKKMGDCKERGKELTDKELDQLNKGRLAAKKEIAALKEKFYDKFRKDLNPRQAERVINFRESKCEQQNKPFPGKNPGKLRPEQFGDRPLRDPHGHGPQPRGLEHEKPFKQQ